MELCQICGREGEDRRTLRLRYFYDLSEIPDKFTKEEVIIKFADGNEVKDTLWSVRTCKDCRGDFLGVLRKWTSGEFVVKTDDDPNCNIPVRVNGRVVMMTTKQWEAHAARNGEEGRIPLRLVRTP